MIWLAIDTAPMDGTKFLAYRRGDVATACLTPRDDCEMWTFGSQTAAVEFYPDVKPTHWMPLPPPPCEGTHGPCAGMNCGITRYDQHHSPECVAQHAASVAGGRFVKIG